MGAEQSQNEDDSPEDSPKVVRIERADVPEEFKMVGVSHEIVDQILRKADATEEQTNNELRRELLAERDENQKLREQIHNLIESKETLRKTAAEQLTLAEMEERKKSFAQTLERIEKQYFSYQPENACRSHEEDIMECVSKNKNKLLNCAPVVDLYKKCAAEFRQKVLEEAQKSSLRT